MKKRLFALLLTLAVTGAALAGCSSSSSESGSTAASAETTAAATTAAPETTAAEAGTEAAAVETEAPAADGTGGEVVQPEGYPSGTVSWVSPTAAGAEVDLITRALVDVLDLGGTVVVENIAGASQTLGTAEVAARPADGQTILSMANACLITQPLMNEVAYSLDDFRFLAMIAPTVPSTICVKADSEIETIEDFIAYIQENKYSWSVPNAGGFGHIVLADTLYQLGAYDNGTMLVYNGSAEAITAILNGEALFGAVDDTAAKPRIESGELKVLAILHDEPSEALPDYPLITDYGVTDISTIVGVKIAAIRKDTPDDIAEFIKYRINEALKSDGYREYLDNMGFGELDYFDEEETTDFVNTAIKQYTPVLQELGLME